jgi:hypothetical protein
MNVVDSSGWIEYFTAGKNADFVTIQPCIKTVLDVIARSVLCDEAIPKRSSWPDKREIASPKNGSQ